MSIQVIFFDIGDTLVKDKQWMPGAKDILADLASHRMRLGLISNTGDLTREQVEALLPDDFDLGIFEEGLVFLSSEIGIEKPELSLFLMAVQHASVSPWQTLFIGENLIETLAAQQAGMQTVRISDSKSDYEALKSRLFS